MSEFKKAAKLDELKENEVKGVSLDGKDIALYLEGGQVFATSNLCTHEACVISENHQIEGKEVECICHGSRFNFETGENTGPPATENLPVYKTKIENEEVFVEV